MKHPGDEVLIREITDFYSFTSESELNRLLLKNVVLFMEGVFDEKVKSATDKKSYQKGFAKLSTGQLLPLRGERLDLWVECESNNKYIVEIKNPKDKHRESIKAIGQILNYSVHFPEANKLVIVSTMYDEGVLEIIEKFNLPIDFVLVTEKSFYLLKKHGKI